MCGFIAVGSVDAGKMEKFRSKIAYAIGVLSHRGPDATNIAVMPNALMAHARLSIVGVSNGLQPLSDASNKVWAVVNGEFYDWRGIKQELQEKGHTFKTDTDSEIVIALYLEYGWRAMLGRLNGEWSMVLFDSRINKWFAARDKFGVRPVLYHLDEDRKTITFASEAKALFALGSVRAQLDASSFYFSQYFQYTPLNATLFSSVASVPPGNALEFSINSGQLSVYPWANWNRVEAITNSSFEENVFLIKKEITAAVHRRIPDEVAWAAHLSAGLDSSIVCALAQSMSQKPVNAYTVSFTDNPLYDEAPNARLTAEYLGLKHHVIPMNLEDLVGAIDVASWHAEGLSINAHLGAKFLLNKAIKADGFKVTLSGEGSDEMFMGYSHLKSDWVGSGSLNSFENAYLKGAQIPDGASLDTSLIEQKLGFVPTWLKAKTSMAAKFSLLYSPTFCDAVAKIENPQSRFIQEAIFDIEQNKSSSLHTSSALWTKYCLGGYILRTLDDAQSMAHSLEGRVPFLDMNVAQAAWSLNSEQYFAGKIEKHILRTAFADMLPEHTIKGVKQSFMSSPLIDGIARNARVREFIADRMFSSKLDSLGIYDKAAIEKLFDKCKAQPNAALEPIVMTIVTLSSLVDSFDIKDMK